MKKYFTVLFLLSTLCLNAQKSILQNEKSINGLIKTLDLIYNFDFDAAQISLKELKSRHPDHPAPTYLQASIYFWQMIPISSEHPKFKMYESTLEESIRQCEVLANLPNTKAEAAFIALCAHASMAMVHAKQKEQLKSVNQARKAYHYMKIGFGLKKTIPDFYFSTGLYDYYVELYPEMHPIFKPFMFFFEKGDKKRGLQEMDQASKTGLFAKTESMYFLGLCLIKYEENPEKALPYFEYLHQKYPQNPFYQAGYTECLILTQHYKEAERLIVLIDQSDKLVMKTAGLAMKGVIAERRDNNYVLAQNLYAQAVNSSVKLGKPLPEFMGYAYLGLAKYHERYNNKKKAEVYAKMVLEQSEYRALNREAEALLKRIKQP